VGLLSAALFYFILLTDNKSEPLIITNGSPVCVLAPPYAAQCGQHRSQAPKAYPASCILHKKDKAANDALGLFSTCIHILSLKMTADILIYHLNVDRSSRLYLL